MGTDYEMVAGRADLYLDRAGPFVAAYFDLPLNHDRPNGPRLTGTDIREHVKDVERYGPGWVEAVAQWVDEYGPARLAGDHRDDHDANGRWTAWEKGDREHFDMGRGEDGVWRAIRVGRPE